MAMLWYWARFCQCLDPSPVPATTNNLSRHQTFKLHLLFVSSQINSSALTLWLLTAGFCFDLMFIHFILLWTTTSFHRSAAYPSKIPIFAVFYGHNKEKCADMQMVAPSLVHCGKCEVEGGGAGLGRGAKGFKMFLSLINKMIVLPDQSG